MYEVEIVSGPKDAVEFACTDYCGGSLEVVDSFKYLGSLIITGNELKRTYPACQLAVARLVATPDLLRSYVVLCNSKLQGYGCGLPLLAYNGSWWLCSISLPPYSYVKHTLKIHEQLSWTCAVVTFGFPLIESLRMPQFVLFCFAIKIWTICNEDTLTTDIFKAQLESS